MSNEFNPQRFTRKPFSVEAIQVTAENMDDVKKWCGGFVLTDETDTRRGPRDYISVNVHKPMNERQKMAYIGDWVVGDGRGFKVFNDKAFRNSFAKEAVPTPSEVAKKAQNPQPVFVKQNEVDMTEVS